VSDSKRYPAPPWDTHGYSAGSAYLVPTRSIELPDGLKPVAVLGRTVGMLAFIEYLPPSPLTYSELIWMPTVVRCRTRDKGTIYGYYVAKMYVDDEATLAAGREMWALPKSLARFERDGERVRVEAEDGTSLELTLRGFGPRKRLKGDVGTIQRDASGVVRFRCTFAGDVQLGSLGVESFSSNDDGWRSFEDAHRLPGSSGMLNDFQATMHAPRPAKL